MTRLCRTSALWLLTSLFLAGSAVAELSVPPLPGEEDPTQPVPNPDVDPEKAKDKISQRVSDATGGGGYVPDPGRGGGGFDQIDDEVGAALTENMVITSIVTGVLALSGAAGWLLASRYIDPKVALMNPQRSMLYGFVKGNPGVHLKQLSTEFRMKTSTVLWHVRKLESADLVRSKKANGYRVFYPVSGGLEASKVSEAVTALSNENARGIFAFLQSTPGAPLRALSEQLSLNAGTVRWHLKKLRKAGLLDEQSGAQGPVLSVTELGLKAWLQVQGIAPQPIQVGAQSVGDTSASEEVSVYN